MYYFTIKDIENLCGIKAHTLRIWEQRYKLFTPKRKESNHRLYDNEDLKQLLRISFLYHHGWKISKIAGLTPEQILHEVHHFGEDKGNYSYFINQLVGCALDFNKEGLIQQLDAIIEKVGFETCIIHTCYPFLQKIGMLWMTNHVIPAQEHFCSYIIQHKIIAQTAQLPMPPANAPEIILFCPYGEFHELPLFFIDYLFRKNGWKTIFLGCNVKTDLIQQFINQKGINYLFVHAITNFTGYTMDDYFETLCKTFPKQTIIATGKSVFQMQRRFTNVKVLQSDREIYSFIQQQTYLGIT